MSIVQFQKVVAYEDLDVSEKKHEFLQTKFKLASQNILLVNTYNEEDLKAIDKESDLLIYTMGDIRLPWENYTVVSSGPLFADLGASPDNRAQLAKDLMPGDSNVFLEYMLKPVPMEDLIQPAPPVKTVDPGPIRKQTLPTLEGSIDNAIASIQYLQTKNITIAIPEIDTCLSSESTENGMSYDEAIALMLFLKRLGAKKLIWNNVEVLSVEKEDS